MPVRFQKSSEYQQRFQWVDSVKSASFVPTNSQAQAPAGVPSEQLGMFMEPPLQHKKRPASTELVSKSWDQGDNVDKGPEPQIQRKKKTPPSATSLAFYADEVQDPDDYVLLGSQSKFSNNVVYKSKHRNSGKTRKNDEANGQVTSPPPAPREKPGPPPPPRVIVDPGAPKLPKKRVEPPKEAPRPPVKSKSAPAVSVGVRPQEKAPPPLPPRAAHHKHQPASKKDREVQHREQKAAAAAAAAELARQKAPKDRREKRGGHMNEFAQTNLDKGIADSGQEAGANYALKYQAGVAPSRPRGPKRMSEYQMQFEWKKGVSSSPLIAAEQVVYNSNPQVAPYKSESFVKSSEYKAQFKPWSVAKSVPDLAAATAAAASVPAAAAAGEAGRRHRHKGHKKQKIQRSRSLEDLTPDKRPAAGSHHDVSESDKRLVKESLNPQKLHFPHGKLKKYKSEYEMNFQSPSRYEYIAGAWKGADPPHLQPKDVETVPTGDDQGSVTSACNWYQEVRELRQKAQEYKQRAQGTHFSRAHLAQLYAQQADLWDTVSNSSILSALSLEVADPEEKKKPRKKQSRKSAWAAEEQDLSLELGSSASQISRSVASSARSRSSTRASSSRASSISSRASTLIADDESNEGRIPTPKMRQVSKAHRHHLDRTTPAVGGALLTSPPRPQGVPYRSVSPSEESEPIRTPQGQVARSEPSRQGVDSHKKRSRHDSKLSQTSGHRTRPSASAPTVMDHAEQLRQSGPTPTFGMPTRDSHVLLDEEASTDRPLHTHYVYSPPQDKSAKRRMAREKFPDVDVPSTINEDGGATYGEPNRATKKSAWVQVGLDDMPQRPLEQDDDIASLSAMSVASSCSLASEVLERARHRRDEFWGNPQGLA